MNDPLFGGRIAAIARARPLSLSILAGLLLAAALPPFHVLPGILALAVPFWILRSEPRSARALAATGLFAFAFALASLWWVAIAFWTDPTRWGALAAPAVLGLCLAYAATILLCWSALRLLRRLPLALFGFLFALAWTASELLRASPWLRFPWNPIASVWAFSDLTLSAVAVFGVATTGLITVAGAVLAGSVLLYPQPWRTVGVAALLLLVAVPAAGGFRLVFLEDVPDTEVRVRLVQAGLGEHHGWQAERMEAWLRRHLELTVAPPAEGPPRLVVWPESAIPYDLEPFDASAELRAAIGRALPAHAVLAAGADRFVQHERGYELTNSLYFLDPSGQVLDRYDKVDLVPFGEFLPFRRLLRRLGLRAFTAGSVDFQPGPGRRTLLLDSLPPLSPLICYEAAYAGRATDDSGRARLLLNVTNDGWFGTSPGPYQHFAMARMRAVETGLPLLRAANTGISAIVDGAGRVRASLALGTVGVLDGVVPAALPPPPIARFPGLAVLAALAAGALCLFADVRAKPRLGTAAMASSMAIVRGEGER